MKPSTETARRNVGRRLDASLLEELQTLARNGLAYARDPYDRERYARFLERCCQQYADLLGVPLAEFRTKLSQELGHITPKVGAEQEQC